MPQFSRLRPRPWKAASCGAWVQDLIPLLININQQVTFPWGSLFQGVYLTCLA